MPTSSKKLITAEDLYKFELISEVRISLDSDNIVYPLKRVDRETEKKYDNLWMVETNPSNFTLYRYTADGSYWRFVRLIYDGMEYQAYSAL
jgi:dipeptidyl aminopeptidase/acylaminoacyl peptidase